jgi:hypothetical protein
MNAVDMLGNIAGTGRAAKSTTPFMKLSGKSARAGMEKSELPKRACNG